MSSWIVAGGVDVVVFGVFAHREGNLRGCCKIIYGETVSACLKSETSQGELTKRWVDG